MIGHRAGDPDIIRSVTKRFTELAGHETP